MIIKPLCIFKDYQLLNSAITFAVFSFSSQPNIWLTEILSAFAYKIVVADAFAGLKIYQKCVCGRGSAPEPTGGAHSAASGPLAGFGGRFTAGEWEGEGRKGEGNGEQEGEEGREKEGKGREGRKGRGRRGEKRGGEGP